MTTAADRLHKKIQHTVDTYGGCRCHWIHLMDNCPAFDSYNELFRYVEYFNETEVEYFVDLYVKTHGMTKELIDILNEHNKAIPSSVGIE